MKKPILAFFVLLLFSFLLPFVLQKSLFPFYRYGMFAEPPKQNLTHETFEILVYENGQFRKFDPMAKGLYPSISEYLMRNYYYRNQANHFLSIMAKDMGAYTEFYMLRHYKDGDAFSNIITLTDTVASYKNPVKVEP